ncbi:MAG: M23 family metallopeptidase [Candidatus Dadabacteria bacterium]|nr:M23 family metallopeptidase [Candidatus Dadabacteria bacterium]MCH7949122.1 M23 family metallopeptidase [Candidatus Dadabacteria bacterium]
METDRYTIMLVTAGHKGAKSFSVKKSHIRIAFCSVMIFAFVSLFSFSTSYIYYKDSATKSQSVNKLISTINLLSQDINKNKIIEAKLKNKLQGIEETLLEMQEVLNKKGIKKELSIGGEFIPPEKLTLSYVDYIKKDIDYLFNTVKSIPVGTPLKGKINSSFGYRKDPFKSRSGFHSGLDIDANYGQHVVATADGVVTKASWHTNYGKTVIVKHKDNYETLYGHLSKLQVKEGQEVKVGDVIGKAGSTGRSTGTHLHYEVIKDGKRVNPKNFLSLK